MGKILSKEELGKFGLRNYETVSDESFQWPHEDVGEGKGEVAAVALTFFNFISSVLFYPINIPKIENAGIRIEIAHSEKYGNLPFRAVRVTMPAGTRIHKVQNVPEELQKFDPEEPDCISVNLTEGEPAIIQTENAGIGIKRTGEKIGIVLFMPKIAIPEFEQIQSPVSQWMQSIDDSWLTSIISENLSRNDSWCSTVATGLFARFWQPPSSTEAVQELLAGKVNDLFAAPRSWAQRLNPAQYETVEDHFLAEIDLLHSSLENLQIGIKPDNEDWKGDLLELCRRRDDLEAVRVLMNETGKAGDLAAVVDSLDRQATQFISCLPFAVKLEDVRLARVARIDPIAWWARLSTEN